MVLSESTQRVLREADRRLRRIRSGDRPSVYRICRIAMASIAPVDAFYIALIRDETSTVFPYTFDRGERTYRWSDDAGALLATPDRLLEDPCH